MARFILLARHGTRQRTWGVKEKDLDLDKDGVKDAREIATGLAEKLSLGSGELKRVEQTWHGTYTHTEHTATIFYDALRRIHDLCRCRKCQLDPTEFWKDAPANGGDRMTKTREIAKDLREAKCQTEGAAILVVGHSPQLGWIAKELLGRPVPLSRSELICIDTCPHGIRACLGRTLLRRPGRLLWTMETSATNDRMMGELREKIKSKMEVVKALGALLVAVLVLYLDPKNTSSATTNDQGSRIIPLFGATQSGHIAGVAATVLLLLAVTLYLMAIYAFDRLTLPTRFWTESLAGLKRTWMVQRPPSSASYVIYENMTRIWRWLFVPASTLTVLGLLLAIFAAFQLSFVFFPIAILLLLTVVGISRCAGPKLGAED